MRKWRWHFGSSRLRTASRRIPILTYHAAHAHGYDYASNDHLALEVDLALIARLGFKVAPLGDVVTWILGEDKAGLLGDDWVAITFDDAPDSEYFDLIHPDVGCLKSFYRLLVESAAIPPADAGPTAVSFAIADPDARADLDRACLGGRGHWRDCWWHEAAGGGVIGIANHSWDHAHPAVPCIRQRDQRKGTFLGIDNLRDARRQIAAAQRLIWYRTGGLVLPYFAYPYGEASDYLVQDYFPNHRAEHGILAAFGTQGDYARPGTNRWHVPRFVCGQHWRSPEELERILVHARSPESI